MSGQDVNWMIAEVGRLETSWSSRLSALRRWYNIIRLENDLAQPGMESVISSDPRTGFNMASWLVTPKNWNYAADTEFLSSDETTEAKKAQVWAERQLKLNILRTRRALHGNVLTRLVRLMLATGWYSVISFPTPHGWIFQTWNPAGVFPEYDNDGNLIKLARVYTITKDEALRKIEHENWLKPNFGKWPGNVTVRSLWIIQQGAVWHGVVMGTHEAKPMTMSPFQHAIPIFTGPVGGLPDDGSIMGNDRWKAEIGMSIVSSVAAVQKNYDKMLTFLQQIVRDIASPKYVEKVKGGQSNVENPEDINRRGAVFTMDVDEDLGPMGSLPIPPDIRSHLFDLRSMVQRGLFSDISFGTATQAVSAFLMSNVTAASKQILDPFEQGTKDVLSAVASENITLHQEWNMPFGDDPLPVLPDVLELLFQYKVEIPGDLINRANVARLLNPEFRVSQSSLYTILMPEVTSAITEMGRLRAEDAMNDEAFRKAVFLNMMEMAANEARELGDDAFAEKLEAALAEVEQIAAPQEQDPNARIGLAAGSLPPEVQEILRAP